MTCTVLFRSANGGTTAKSRWPLTMKSHGVLNLQTIESANLSTVFGFYPPAGRRRGVTALGLPKGAHLLLPWPWAPRRARCLISPSGPSLPAVAMLVSTSMHHWARSFFILPYARVTPIHTRLVTGLRVFTGNMGFMGLGLKARSLGSAPRSRLKPHRFFLLPVIG